MRALEFLGSDGSGYALVPIAQDDIVRWACSVTFTDLPDRDRQHAHSE